MSRSLSSTSTKATATRPPSRWISPCSSALASGPRNPTLAVGEWVRLHSDDDDTLYHAEVIEKLSDRDYRVAIKFDSCVPVLNRAWSASSVHPALTPKPRRLRRSTVNSCLKPATMHGTLLLCDSAESINGKLYTMGIGWTSHPPDTPANIAIAALIYVPYDQTNTAHKGAIKLVTEDGDPYPPPSQGPPAQFDFDFEVGRPLDSRRARNRQLRLPAKSLALCSQRVRIDLNFISMANQSRQRRSEPGDLRPLVDWLTV